MINETRSIQDVIDFLNELLKVDENAVRLLIEQRVPCNNELADHPTVQVRSRPNTQPVVGLLGILNGLYGIDEKGYGPIGAIIESDGHISSFERVKHKGD